jgi:hypothetical protein
MLDRRRAVLQNLAFVVGVVLSFYATASLWGRSGSSFFALYLSVALLGATMSLSSAVPFWNPRPKAAARVTMGLWAVAYLIAIIDAGHEGDLTGAAFYGLGAALILQIYVRERARSLARPRQWLGAALLVGALLMGADLLTGPGAPGDPQQGIGLTASDAHLATPGLAVHLHVYPNGCSRPTADVEVFGSEQFWRAVKNQPGNPELQLVLPAGSAHDVFVDAVSDPVEAYSETLPEQFNSTLYPAIKHGRVVRAGSTEALPVWATLKSVEAFDHYEVIDAHVSHNWADVREPIQFWFEPEWLTPNGLQTCYLQTPPLFGPVVWPFSSESAWNAINAGHLTEPSIAAVTVHDAEYVGGVSRPEPTGGSAASLTWTCGPNEPPGPERPIDERRVESFRTRDFRRRQAFDCGETTPLEEPTAATFRDLAIFLIGGLVSLGLALVIGTGGSSEEPRAG